jgi:hypothetical protein
MKQIVRMAAAMFIAVALLSACARDKGPAELAIKAAEEAVNQVRGEAAKYVPDEMKNLESALTAAKEKFNNKDYKAALAEAQGLVGKAKEVLTAANAKKDELIKKKDELTKSWTNLTTGLPRMIEAIQQRVDILSTAKKLPANLTKEKFEEVKLGLAATKVEWLKAQQSFSSGSLDDAVAMANSVKDKAVKAMETLGLPIPEAAKS